MLVYDKEIKCVVITKTTCPMKLHYSAQDQFVYNILLNCIRKES